VERLHYRSTSLTDIQAELHQEDLLREARGRSEDRLPRRVRGLPFGLRLLRRRTSP
jgi:hypothetical protein